MFCWTDFVIFVILIYVLHFVLIFVNLQISVTFINLVTNVLQY